MRSDTGGLLPAQRLAARAFVCHQRGAARDGTGPIEERSKRTDARAHGVLGVRGGRPVEKRVQGRAEADIPALFRASTSRRSIVYSTGFRTRSRAPSTPRAAQRPFQSYGVLVIRLFLKLWYTRHLLRSIGKFKVPLAIQLLFCSFGLSTNQPAVFFSYIKSASATSHQLGSSTFLL